MAQLLSLPFRVSPAGQAVSLEQGSDDYYQQQIATILMTIQGERLLSDELGMPDMAYEGFMHSTFQAQVETILPEISELNVSIEDVTNTSEAITVTFNVLQEQI